MKILRTLAALVLACALGFPSAPARAGDDRHSLEFHGADLPAAIALVSAEFNVRMVADGSVPHTKAPDRIPNMTLSEVLDLFHSYGLDYTVSNVNGQKLYTFSSADWLAHAGVGGIYQRTLRYATVDDKLSDWLKSNLPVGTSVYVMPSAQRVVVVGTATAQQRAKALLDSIDITTYGGGADAYSPFVTKSVKLKYTKPSDIAQKLGFGRGGAAGGTSSTAATAGYQAPGLAGASTSGNSGGSSGDNVIADDHTSLLVLSGRRDFVEQSLAKIALLDVPAAQGKFDVQIFSVTKTGAKNLGVLWSGTSNSSSSTSSTGSSSTSTSGSVTPGASTWTFVNGTIPIFATINAQIQNNNAKFIAKTQILVSSNQKGMLRAGERYPFPVIDSVTGVVSYQEEDVGVIINITPTFAPEQCVLDLHLEDSDIIGTVNNQYPLISEDTFDGPGIRLGYDDTLVLAGLMKNTSSDVLTKVPLLGDLPLIGGFFRNRSKSTEEDQLMFLFTPHRDLGA